MPPKRRAKAAAASSAGAAGTDPAAAQQPPSSELEARLPWRKTLTKYERTNIIGLRAEQLARGAQPFVDASDPFDPYEVAERELAMRRLPFIVVRPTPDGKTEQVRVDEMGVVAA